MIPVTRRRVTACTSVHERPMIESQPLSVKFAATESLIVILPNLSATIPSNTAGWPSVSPGGPLYVFGDFHFVGLKISPITPTGTHTHTQRVRAVVSSMLSEQLPQE